MFPMIRPRLPNEISKEIDFVYMSYYNFEKLFCQLIILQQEFIFTDQLRIEGNLLYTFFRIF